MNEKKMCSESKSLLEDFIRIYENNPCLWRVKSKDYHDKSKRDAAYDLLLQQYRLIDPNADKNVVIRKINAFRTNYRREKKKVDKSRHSGIGTDELYEPSLWYYQLFTFLDDQETPRGSSSNLEIEEDELDLTIENSGELMEDSVEEQEPSQSSHSKHDISVSNNKSISTKKAPPTRPFKRSNDKFDSVLDSIEDHFKKPKLKDDRHDIFGKNVAVKIRDISNNSNIQRLLAEKIINDALFMAEMGQLTLSHSIRGPNNEHSVTNNAHLINNDKYPQASSYYYQGLYPVPNSGASTNSENSNQSLTSYVSNFSDT